MSNDREQVRKTNEREKAIQALEQYMEHAEKAEMEVAEIAGLLHGQAHKTVRRSSTLHPLQLQP